MSSKKDKAPRTPADQAYEIYRPGGVTTTIEGFAGCQVQDGALLFTNPAGVVVQVYGPGQWLTVNVPPVNAAEAKPARREAR